MENEIGCMYVMINCDVDFEKPVINQLKSRDLIKEVMESRHTNKTKIRKFRGF